MRWMVNFLLVKSWWIKKVWNWNRLCDEHDKMNFLVVIIIDWLMKCVITGMWTRIARGIVSSMWCEIACVIWLLKIMMRLVMIMIPRSFLASGYDVEVIDSEFYKANEKWFQLVVWYKVDGKWFQLVIWYKVDE